MVWRGIEEKFIKDRDKSDGVRLRADASIIATNSRVCDMIFMVRGVQIDPVPARRKVNLGAERYAVFRRKADVLGRAIRGFTHDSDSELGLVRGVEGALEKTLEVDRSVQGGFLLTACCCLQQSFGNPAERQGPLQIYCSILL